jgi:hypothetical protein
LPGPAPRGGHHDQPGPALAEQLEQAGEAQVVAGGQADRGAVDLDGHRLAARGHRVGLGEPEGVEQVDLVVTGLDPAAGGQQGVVHPPVLGRGEHPDHHRDPGRRRDLAHPGRPGSVQWFGDRTELHPETAHGGLGEHHQPGSRRRRGAHPLGEQLEVPFRLLGGRDLGQGDLHGVPFRRAVPAR